MVGLVHLAAGATRGAPAGSQGPRRILSRDGEAGSKRSWGEDGGTARGVWRRPPSHQRRGRDRRPFVPRRPRITYRRFLRVVWGPWAADVRYQDDRQ